MEWILALVALAGIGTATPLVRRRARSRRTDRLRTAEVFRLNRNLADADVTQFGEELMDLHVETLTTDLDPAMTESYQQALDSYDRAQAVLLRPRPRPCLARRDVDPARWHRAGDPGLLPRRRATRGG